jgi:hypothetical protein
MIYTEPTWFNSQADKIESLVLVGMFFLDAQGTVYHDGRVVEGLSPIREFDGDLLGSFFIDYEGQAWTIRSTCDVINRLIMIEGLPPHIRSINHYSRRIIILCQDGSVWTGLLLSSSKVTELKRLELNVQKLAFGHAAIAVRVGNNIHVILDNQHQLHYFRSDGTQAKIDDVAAFEIDSRSIIILHLNGQVSMSRDQLETIQPVEGLEDIRAVSCDDGSFLALTSDGQVYRWGSNGYRHPGQEITDREDNNPQVITKLPPIRDLLACLGSLFFVSVNNELLMITIITSICRAARVIDTSHIPYRLYLRKIPDQPMIKSNHS